MTESVESGATPSSSSKRNLSPTAFRKPCTLCQRPRSVLVRCQIDETSTWHFVCTGKCWKSVSGGTVDAAGYKDEYPHYRYGGMWKNKHEGVSAKKKRKGRATNFGKEEGVGGPVKEWMVGVEYTRNDLVRVPVDGSEWMCRRSHRGEELNGPMSKKGYRWWKEDDQRVTAETEGCSPKNKVEPGVNTSRN